jgi:hypothetical protein
VAVRENGNWTLVTLPFLIEATAGRAVAPHDFWLLTIPRIDGIPSHKMMSFCFFLGREGGRNSATISFLNRVRNMSGHYLALAMQGEDSGVMARRKRRRTQRSLPVVDLSIAEGKLMLHVRGADKLWAFKSSLEIRLVHIAGVRADPEAASGWYHGIRMPGTNVPGVITAGTFYQDGKRVFWDVHNPEKTIVIDLHDERYNELVVEVNDPDAAVKLIQNGL